MIGAFLITGFLGSGKSTALNRILRHPGMVDTLVIVNEFGDVGIDAALIEWAEDDTVMLSSGCLCCTVRSALSETLTELFNKRESLELPPYRRVVIETSGLAEPGAVARSLVEDTFLAERYALEAIVATVDAMNGMETINKYNEARQQVKLADHILLTKGDVAGIEGINAVHGLVLQLNPSAVIEEAIQGEFDIGAMIERNWRTCFTNQSTQVGGERMHQSGGVSNRHLQEHSAHSRGIEVFSVRIQSPLYWVEIAKALDHIVHRFGERVLRVKGLVNVRGSEPPIAVHCVQGVFHPPIILERWPDDERVTTLVFITDGDEREGIMDCLPAETTLVAN